MGIIRKVIGWIKGEPSKETLLTKIKSKHPKWSERHSDLIRFCATMDYKARWHWKIDKLESLSKNQLQKVLNKCV